MGFIMHNTVLPRVPVGIPSALRESLPRTHSPPAPKLLRAVSPQAKTWTQVPSETEKKVTLQDSQGRFDSSLFSASLSDSYLGL